MLLAHIRDSGYAVGVFDLTNLSFSGAVFSVVIWQERRTCPW